MSKDLENAPPSEVSEGSEESNWLDVEPDVENVEFISLFDKQSFRTLGGMLNDCREKYDFDLVGTIRRLELDFLGAVKLINFIRHQTQVGKAVPRCISLESIADESLLKPVLENDAVIFSLDEILDMQADEASDQSNTSADKSRELHSRNKQLEAELEAVRDSFANYRLAVEQTLDRRWGVDDAQPTTTRTKESDPSSSYFESYAFNDIHETMLKDVVRTDAYRDFIYDNKHVFKGKVVLDIGCGTGILSMFCAKAGAAKVIAVDKSEIINKARENIFNNNLSDTITCIKGAIEDVSLPVDKVDIIVSEWMGYCLLYEAMLPSVLFARDHYLKPDGLIAPSSATIWIAPVEDQSYVSDHVSFWRDVYGFDMKAMQEGICDEVRVEAMPPSCLCGDAYPFKVLDLYSITAEDLVFSANWETKINPGVQNHDGFLIWFDNFFAPSRDQQVPEAFTTPKDFMSQSPGNIAFTTGPRGLETHWKQGLLLASSPEPQSNEVANRQVSGQVEFSVHQNNARALNIRVDWSSEGKKSTQTWELK